MAECLTISTFSLHIYAVAYHFPVV